MAWDRPISHFQIEGNDSVRLHFLENHLRGVAERAAGFAQPFGAEGAAWLAGLWHDLGKHSRAFQAMMARNLAKERDPDAALAAEHSGRVDHSSAGAIRAADRLGVFGRLLAFAMAGHHAGLPDHSDDTSQATLQARLKKRDLLAAAQAGGIPPAIWEPQAAQAASPFQGKVDGAAAALWVRMIFSCLVDADRLDAEAFSRPDQAALRGHYPSLAELEPLLINYLAELAAAAPPGPVNQARAEVLAQCRAAASRPPGVHTLTVPTGGGKTLSSLAFALKHARAHGLARIIYVIPYTSIIEQTAEIFRGIFGDAVLEHHSNLDPKKDTYANQRAAENWDAPLIVTTAVQFFESLFAAHPSRCRKLHRIAASVVVLDEAQLLPPHLLQPILHVLRELAAGFRASILVCTATQPAWEPRQGMDQRFAGLPSAGDLVDDPGDLHQRLQRVEVRLPDDLNAPTTWEDLAQRLRAEPSALCIVNTRRHARELAGLLPQAAHLSAAMCAQHRSEVIAAIKARLKAGEPTLVVSTQLVECGVDFSFPAVYRALAGLDSIAQAAGRCNREGELLPGLGRLEVFAPPEPPHEGHLRQAAECGRRLLAGGAADPLAPERFQAFFRELYWLKGDGLDEKQILRLSREFKFRSVEAAFRMIDQDGPPVLTLYGQGAELIARLRREGPSRDLLRRLQRFAVTVPARDSAAWLKQGLVEELAGGHLVQYAPGLYHPRFGLGCGDATRRPADLIG
ncbi:MAG: CRISPR-associated helicase Cas3' [Thermodesulfobacteriota bacterium]